VEDPTRLEEGAREQAVRNALSKAEQLASLANVSLGSPVLISESLGFTVPPMQRGEAAAADAATPISPAQVEVRVTVQAVYAIR
jgi:uncharacterized protein YggE